MTTITNEKLLGILECFYDKIFQDVEEESRIEVFKKLSFEEQQESLAEFLEILYDNF